MECLIVLIILSASNLFLWIGLLATVFWHKCEDEELDSLYRKHKHIRKELNETMCDNYNNKIDIEHIQVEQKELQEMYSNLNSRINQEILKGVYKK